jgi:hypothetical protein
MALRISNSTIVGDGREIVNYGILKNNLGNITSTATVNLASGNYVTATVTGAVTLTFTTGIASTNTSGFILQLTNGGAFAITWPASVKWPGATAPTLTASGVDILSFITPDAGTNWYAVASMLDVR